MPDLQSIRLDIKDVRETVEKNMQMTLRDKFIKHLSGMIEYDLNGMKDTVFCYYENDDKLIVVNNLGGIQIYTTPRNLNNFDVVGTVSTSAEAIGVEHIRGSSRIIIMLDNGSVKIFDMSTETFVVPDGVVNDIPTKSDGEYLTAIYDWVTLKDGILFFGKTNENNLVSFLATDDGSRIIYTKTYDTNNYFDSITAFKGTDYIDILTNASELIRYDIKSNLITYLSNKNKLFNGIDDCGIIYTTDDEIIIYTKFQNEMYVYKYDVTARGYEKIKDIVLGEYGIDYNIIKPIMIRMYNSSIITIGSNVAYGMILYYDSTTYEIYDIALNKSGNSTYHNAFSFGINVFDNIAVITKDTQNNRDIKLYTFELKDTINVTIPDAATETTLSNINNKITKCDTDNVHLASELAYDSNTNTKKVNIVIDSVGIAKDNTLSNLSNKITKCDTDAVKIIDEPYTDITVGAKKVSIANDTYGLAKETTLGTLNAKITKCDTDNTITNIRDQGNNIINPATDDVLQRVEDKIRNYNTALTVEHINKTKYDVVIISDGHNLISEEFMYDDKLNTKAIIEYTGSNGELTIELGPLYNMSIKRIDALLGTTAVSMNVHYSIEYTDGSIAVSPTRNMSTGNIEHIWMDLEDKDIKRIYIIMDSLNSGEEVHVYGIVAELFNYTRLVNRDGSTANPATEETLSSISNRFSNVYASQEFTDPAINPELTLDCNGKPFVEIYVKSINSGSLVKIYGSVDNSTWRYFPNNDLTTVDDGQGNYIANDVLKKGYRYIKVILLETGSGTSLIEISASG